MNSTVTSVHSNQCWYFAVASKEYYAPRLPTMDLIWIAYYTLFKTICKHRQKHFFAKKIEFRETWQKHIYTSTHYSSSTAVFAKIENIPYYRRKVLCVCQEMAYSSEHVSQNVHESWQITLYTLFVFCTSFVISSVFIIVCK